MSQAASLTGVWDIDGARAGASVTFTKIYDPGGRRHKKPVRYHGVVDAPATRITGTWMIPAVWSGSFIMTRSPGGKAEVAVERRALEPVS
jgi:hypothetical protein